MTASESEGKIGDKPVNKRVSKSGRSRSKSSEFFEFPEGWGTLGRSGTVAHWFQLSARGRVVSLCRMLRDQPKHIDQTKVMRKCGVCLDVMARSGTFNPVIARRSVELEERDMATVLKIRLAAEIDRFMADLSRGPRLYVCPTCRQAYEGRSDQPYLCDGSRDNEHAPVRVLELARKDGPTGRTA